MNWARTSSAIALVGAFVLGPSTLAAFAGTGQYVPAVGSVVFYYDLSSGNGGSYLKWGSGSNDRMCMDAPGSSSYATFVGHVYWHRTFLSDPAQVSGARAYSDPAMASGQYSSYTSREYYSHSTWNWSGNLTGQPSGYVEICD